MIRRIRKKQLIIGLCTIAVLVSGVLLGKHIARTYPYRENGRYYIPAEFSKIHLPDTLRFTSKEWNDVNADDSSLESMWVYNYENTKPVSNKATEELVKASLRQAGFSIDYEQELDDPASIRFDATNSKLNMTVSVGDTCNRPCEPKPAGTTVTILAMLPVDKANLEY